MAVALLPLAVTLWRVAADGPPAPAALVDDAPAADEEVASRALPDLADIESLRDRPRACRAALEAADIVFTPAPDAASADACDIPNPVAVERAGAPFDQAAVLNCPTAAVVARFVQEVVQPAAQEHFGREVAEIDQFASYVCRNVAGSERLSRHATAQAIDIGAFTLAGGERISVADHWGAEGPAGAFLRDVRDGACAYFSAVLGPEYNRSHADHLHLELGRWEICS